MTLWGIDVSSYQEALTQTTVNATDVLVVKATEGTGYQNPLFQTHFNMGVAGSKIVGAYHFWRAGSGTAQADYFLATVGANQPDFYVLDFEDASEASNESGALEFLRRVEQKTGKKPLFYTYGSQLVKHQYSTIGDAGYPLWLAHYYYSSADGFGTDKNLDFVKSYWGLSGWKLAGWQYTEAGRLPGYSGNLDFNLFDENYVKLTVKGGSTPAATGRMVYPVEGFKITQNFGDGADLATNLGGGHTGTDFGTPVGTPIKAVADGVVLWADWAKNLPRTSWEARWYLVGGGYGGVFTDAGIVTVIDHGTYLTTYSHQNRTDLNIGDRVKCGQVIGETGNTGYTFGPHLHFERLDKPFAWGNGFYGRTDPLAPIRASQQAQTTSTLKKGVQKMHEVLTTKLKNMRGGTTTLADEVSWLPKNFERVFQAIANVRLEVLNTKLPKYGETQPKGGITSLALEVSYLADNFARVLGKLDEISARLDRLEKK